MLRSRPRIARRLSGIKLEKRRNRSGREAKIDGGETSRVDCLLSGTDGCIKKIKKCLDLLDLSFALGHG